jgi:hypothetical protein
MRYHRTPAPRGIARAESDLTTADQRLTTAAAGFRAAGQPGDADRCERAIVDLARLVTSSSVPLVADTAEPGLRPSPELVNDP